MADAFEVRKDEKRAAMERACATTKASADLLERRGLTYAAVGEADIGLANGAASLKATEFAFVTERDFFLHLQRGLASTRAAREDARRALVLEDERDGGGTILPKRCLLYTSPSPRD